MSVHPYHCKSRQFTHHLPFPNTLDWTHWFKYNVSSTFCTFPLPTLGHKKLKASHTTYNYNLTFLLYRSLTPVFGTPRPWVRILISKRTSAIVGTFIVLCKKQPFDECSRWPRGSCKYLKHIFRVTSGLEMAKLSNPQQKNNQHARKCSRSY